LIDDVLKYEKRLFAQIMAQQRAISALFEEFTRSVAPYLAQYKSRGVVADSVWNRNIKIESAINAQLVRLQKDLTEYLNAQSVKAWNLSHDKTDLIVKDYIKSMAISDVARQGLFFRNVDALKAFQNRAVNGMNLSQRVWKICAETKSQLELYLQSGLSQGRSAAQISRDVRGF
jgi:tRNA/tmRNA/rRNA uracil-C5-methylase (TrmA/RlmC/RlmD family)